MTNTIEAAAGAAAAPKPRRRLGATLEPLRPLLPYALRYKRTIVFALVALIVAAGATLTLPLAVRGMIDHGFSTDSAGAVNAYFGAMIAVAATLAVASGTRYYFVMTLGERVVADLRGDLFRHLTTSRRRLLRHGENRRASVAADRRHDAAEIRLRLVGLGRAAQSLHVLRRDRHDGGDEPQARRDGARGHSRSSSCRSSPRAVGAPPLAIRAGHAGARPPPMPGKIFRPCAPCRRNGAQASTMARFRRAVGGRL